MADITLRVAPAPLGTEFEFCVWACFRCKKKQTARLEAARDTLKSGGQISEIDQSIGRKHEIIMRRTVREGRFDVSDFEMTIKPARPRPLDHRGTEIDAVDLPRHAGKYLSGKPRSATKIERDEIAGSGD